MRKIRSRRAVSPVIATVILVAVAITVAVAVAYWMGGIAGQYTKFEKIEIQSAVCTWNSTAFDWEIEMKLKNSGTATATLTSVFINNIEVDLYDGTDPGDGAATTDMGTRKIIESGATAIVNIDIDGVGDLGEGVPPVPKTDYWQSVSSGTTVNIKLHSAGGYDYIKLIELV